ncbi:hypothetical protein B0H34DRAFT_794796 [Crassisporium funariophilum]|nr:hypothetical protein B0H34DRAFT_794796 [Crassisporium funariophilum]
MLEALDAGVWSDDMCHLVEKYTFAWWNLGKEPNADAVGFQYWHPPPLANANAGAGNTAWDFAQAQGLTIKEPRPHYAPRNGGRTLPIHPSIPELQNTPKCPKCRQYKRLAGDAVAKIQAIWGCATLLETAAKIHVSLDVRHASGLYTLHEAVLSKELNVPSVLAPAPAPSPELKYRKTVENV